jgi:hypothetical protein
MLEPWSLGLQIGFPNSLVSFIFSFIKPWPQYKAIKFGILLVLGGRLRRFFIFYFVLAMTPSVKAHWGWSIPFFAPIGMLDLS